jgi:hypothetical protein
MLFGTGGDGSHPRAETYEGLRLPGGSNLATLLAKQARLQGLMVGSTRQQQDYVAALEQSGVRPVLDGSFSLDQLADAFCYQASGVHFGKVAVEW